MQQPVSAIHLLSIGTTTSQFSFAHAHGRQLGSFEWWREQRLVNVIIASQQRSVDYMMGHRLTDRYLRLDADQSKEQERHLALDVATEAAQQTIRGLAAATIQSHINDARLKAFLVHTAAAPVFHHRTTGIEHFCFFIKPLHDFSRMPRRVLSSAPRLPGSSSCALAASATSTVRRMDEGAPLFRACGRKGGAEISEQKIPLSTKVSVPLTTCRSIFYGARIAPIQGHNSFR